MEPTDRPVGRSTSNRASILKKPITQGGFGRALTTTECAALRAFGIRCSTRWYVVRQVGNIAYLGICYRPNPNGGYDHAGIYVEQQ